MGFASTEALDIWVPILLDNEILSEFIFTSIFVLRLLLWNCESLHLRTFFDKDGCSTQFLPYFAKIFHVCVISFYTYTRALGLGLAFFALGRNENSKTKTMVHDCCHFYQVCWPLFQLLLFLHNKIFHYRVEPKASDNKCKSEMLGQFHDAYIYILACCQFPRFTHQPQCDKSEGISHTLPNLCGCCDPYSPTTALFAPELYTMFCGM